MFATNLVHVACNQPSLDHPLLSLNITKRLLTVKACDETFGLTVVDSVVKDRLEELLVTNKALKFTEYHVPSVQMALAMNANLSDKSDYKRIFDWQSVKWDESINAFRPLAPFEGVVRFR